MKCAYDTDINNKKIAVLALVSINRMPSKNSLQFINE